MGPRALRAPGALPQACGRIAAASRHACAVNVLLTPEYKTYEPGSHAAAVQVSGVEHCPGLAGLTAKVSETWMVDDYTKKDMLHGTAERGAILVNDVEMVLVRSDHEEHDDDEHPVHSHTHPRRPRTAPPAATAMSLCRHGEPDMSTRPGLLHCRLPCPCLASNVGARAVAVCGKRARALAALE